MKLSQGGTGERNLMSIALADEQMLFFLVAKDWPSYFKVSGSTIVSTCNANFLQGIVWQL